MIRDFPTGYQAILDRIDSFIPYEYAKTRNYLDGAVSYLSPYISRGVISTQLVLKRLLDNGHEISRMEKFVQELAWRDYWQQVWAAKRERINLDLRHAQEQVDHFQIAQAVLNANTGIDALDKGIKELYVSGYMHNHMRMYVAFLTCNIGRAHWKIPAKWLYFHLLDGDWASNTLSWQWVVGTNSNKKYIANQDNINTFCKTNQSGTFLDVSYEELSSLNKPSRLLETNMPTLNTTLPKANKVRVNPSIPTLIYNYYNLDPLWYSNLKSNRILLLEPSVFRKYPISSKCLDFCLSLSKNIPDIKIYTGSFEDFRVEHLQTQSEVYYKEHPLNNYAGIEENRDWMFDVQGYYPSFFGFWEKCKKQLNFTK